MMLAGLCAVDVSAQDPAPIRLTTTVLKADKKATELKPFVSKAPDHVVVRLNADENKTPVLDQARIPLEELIPVHPLGQQLDEPLGLVETTAIRQDRGRVDLTVGSGRCADGGDDESSWFRRFQPLDDGSIPAGVTRWLVDNPGLASDSLLVVTLDADACSCNWVAEHGNSYVALPFHDATKHPIPFAFQFKQPLSP